ncbi:NAD+ synthase [Nanoarchaeota archaeon]
MKELIQKTKEFFIQNSRSKAVLGLSGGIDSAVTAKILTHALGPENVAVLIMPEEGLSEHTNDAINLAQQLGISYKVIKINFFLEQFKNLEWPQTKLAEINTKARIRAILLYNFANSNNALVAGTSNKTELILGYGTKYGDLACDTFIIGNLYKTEVYNLAKQLNIPENIINKPPTAELYPGQTDEQELGATYQEIDKVLGALTTQQDLSQFDQTLVNNIQHRIKNNEHKRKMAQVIK